MVYTTPWSCIWGLHRGSTKLRLPAIVAIHLSLLAAAPAMGSSPTVHKPKPKVLALHGYVQLRYTNVNSHASTFGIRFLKAQLTWHPVRSLKIYSQLAYLYGTHNVDDNRVWLEDMWAQHRLLAGTVKFGQLKPSFGLENMQPATTLLTMDRAAVSTDLAPNGGFSHSFGRDIGAQYQQGRPADGQFTLGLFAGTGSGSEAPMRATGLVTLHGIKQWELHSAKLQLGLSAAFRHDENVNFSKALPSTSILNTSHFHGSDQRYNAEMLATSGYWRLQSEVAYAMFTRGSGIRNIEAYGAYAELACRPSRCFEMVLKAETYDPDTRIAVRETLHDYTFGVNIHLPGFRHKLMLDYVLKSGASSNVIQVQYQHTY